MAPISGKSFTSQKHYFPIIAIIVTLLSSATVVQYFQVIFAVFVLLFCSEVPQLTFISAVRSKWAELVDDQEGYCTSFRPLRLVNSVVSDNQLHSRKGVGISQPRQSTKSTVWVKKIAPWGLVEILPRRMGIFQPSFTCLLCIPIYARLRIFIQLDRQGRARREAARRRKSEWKVNVAIPNSSRSNGSWQITPKTVSLCIVEPRGIWTCVSLQCTSTSGGSICALKRFCLWAKVHHASGCVDTPTSPEVGD